MIHLIIITIIKKKEKQIKRDEKRDLFFSFKKKKVCKILNKNIHQNENNNKSIIELLKYCN